MTEEQNERIQEICFSMLEVSWEGNITPMAWFKHLRYESGRYANKPHLVAITILSDVAYWYRPTEIRDEFTGQVIGYRQKFAGHKLQRNYSYYEKLFGFTIQQGRDAINFLVEKKLLTREVVEKLELPNGQTIYNVMYLEINPEALLKITKPKRTLCSPEQTPLSGEQTYTEINSFLSLNNSSGSNYNQTEIDFNNSLFDEGDES